MGYRFKTGETVAVALHRILREQIEGAIADLRHPDRAYGVHEARKRFKRCRSLLRLLRSGLNDRFQTENQRLRQMGHALAALREVAALREALQRLQAEQRLPAGAAAAMGRRLAARRRSSRGGAAEIAQVQEQLIAWWGGVAGWPLAAVTEADLFRGLERSYQRGRRAWRAATAAPSAERYHEWRKRVKDLGYQLRLLTELWPIPMAAWQQELDRLADLLGDDHDLAALSELLQEGPRRPTDDAMAAAITQSQQWLRREADRLARRIYAERPAAFGHRMVRWWRAWQRD